MPLLMDAATRRPDEMPPALTSDQVDGVLSGDLKVPTAAQLKAHLAVDYCTPGRRGHTPDVLFGRQHTPTAMLPDPKVWSARFSQVLVEVLAGRRSPSQLNRHVDSTVLPYITRRYRTNVRRGPAPGQTSVRRVRVCEPRDGVAEVAVVARINGRPTALALRLNGADGRWIVTVLEMA